MSAEDITSPEQTPTPGASLPEPQGQDAALRDDAQADTRADTRADAQADAQADTQDEAQDDAGDKPRDDKGRFKGVQPRIDELTRARREAEREAAYWRQRATQGQAEPQAAQPAVKPTPEQFTDYAEYVEALTDWKTEQKLDERMQQESARQAQAARAQTFQERAAAYQTQAPDFDEVLSSADVPMARHVGAAILESDVGPQLAYHLARNPQELERLNRMPEAAANREIGRLEASLAKPAAAAAAPPVRASSAPKPATPIGSQGRAATLDPSRMSMDEYAAMRKGQGARWASR